MTIGWLKQLVPQAARSKLRRSWTQFRHRGSNYFCPICGSHLREFVPSGNEPAFRCPVCISKPPHRLALRYFELHPELFITGETLVHIAPEPELGRWLNVRAKQAGMTYRPGGIKGIGAEHLDLRGLPFADRSIHLFYCCHVLNAMQEDRQAMAEIHRVMHPQGVALLQVPAFHQGDQTLETHSLTERMAAFHDEGIYRCYTDEDYISRLNAVGFHVEHFRATEQPAELVQRTQLKQEVLHVCRRSESPS